MPICREPVVAAGAGAAVFAATATLHTAALDAAGVGVAEGAADASVVAATVKTVGAVPPSIIHVDMVTDLRIFWDL